MDQRSSKGRCCGQSHRTCACARTLSLNRKYSRNGYDLFRTGYFAWGLNLSNPDPPFFHFTDRGRRALERLSRDPGNPAGYLQYLASVAKLNPIASSYLGEGLDCCRRESYS